MRKAEVSKALAEGQKTFYANVSDRRTLVRLVGESRYGGWDAVNISTGRAIRIKTAARLHGVAR